MTDYEFDIHRLSIGELLMLTKKNLPVDELLDLVNKATDVDILREPTSELPRVMTGFAKEVAEQMDYVSIAIASLGWHLNDEDS